MGTGPTINEITQEEWDFLEKQHTIGFGEFSFSRKKLEYYLSIERSWGDIPMMMIMKKDNQMDTTLILGVTESIRFALNAGFKNIIQTFKGTALFPPDNLPWFEDEEPPNKILECMAPSFRYPLFRFRGSLTAVINSALILGAEEIRLCGIDLYSQDDFYDDPKWRPDSFTQNLYEQVSIAQQKHLIKKEDMHKTAQPYIDGNRWGEKKLRNITDVLERIDKEMVEVDLSGIFTTNKKSLLYTQNKLQYKGIMD